MQHSGRLVSTVGPPDLTTPLGTQYILEGIDVGQREGSRPPSVQFHNLENLRTEQGWAPLCGAAGVLSGFCPWPQATVRRGVFQSPYILGCLNLNGLFPATKMLQSG